MSIQRFNVIKYGAHPTPNGSYMLYDDHIAALLTQDRQHMEALRQARIESQVWHYEQGQKDAFMQAYDVQGNYDAGVHDANQKVHQFVSALVYSQGGEVTITFHDLLTVDENTVLQRIDNADGSITLRVERIGND
jgi:hypothetical protein